MKVPVHKKIETSEHTQAFAMEGRIRRILMAAVTVFMLICTAAAMLFQFSLFNLLFIAVCVCMLYYVLRGEQFRKEIGMLELGDSIVFNVRGNEKNFFCKTYEYAEIAELCIGECPAQFRCSKYRGVAFSTEEWSAFYGDRYIIAKDKNENSLFACVYDEAVWNFLHEKCQRQEVKIYNEEAYGKKLCKRRAIEEQTYQENGGQAIVDMYEGYIN